MDTSIYISIGSLCIAFLALGWNIYRDVILKPRLIVKFNFKAINQTKENPPRIFLVDPNEMPHLTGKYLFALDITNKGPGKIKLINIFASKSIIQRLKRYKEPHSAIIIPDIKPPLSKQLPEVLDQAEDTTLGFYITPENRESLENFKYIGVTDSYDRKHWAKSDDIKRALQNLNRYEEKKGVKVT